MLLSFANTAPPFILEFSLNVQFSIPIVECLESMAPIRMPKFPWKNVSVKLTLLLTSINNVISLFLSLKEEPKWKFSPLMIILVTWLSEIIVSFVQMMLTSACPLSIRLETFSRCTEVDRLWLPAMNSRIDPVAKHSLACWAHCSRVRQDWPGQGEEREALGVKWWR